MRKNVLLGFSGGIDSTAAARYLAEQGHAVTLLTLDTVGEEGLETRIRQAAGRLNLPFRIENVREVFREEIVRYFTGSYLRGETPAPCTRCNPRVKWKTLYDIARREHYDHIATGHYFRVRCENGKYFVRTAADPAKDQSYYLWGLSQEYLRIALTPMGERIKKAVTASLPSALRSRESMGVCFLQGLSYSEFLKTQVPGIVPGEIVDARGKTIGRHDGCAFYTIGQKRGLRTDSGEPVVVTGIDAARNRVTAGCDADLFYRRLTVREFCAADPQRLTDSQTVRVKIRGVGRNPEGYARVRIDGQSLLVELREPAWAPAKGQPVVFYDGDLVVGGGLLADCRR